MHPHACKPSYLCAVVKPGDDGVLGIIQVRIVDRGARAEDRIDAVRSQIGAACGQTHKRIGELSIWARLGRLRTYLAGKAAHRKRTAALQLQEHADGRGRSNPLPAACHRPGAKQAAASKSKRSSEADMFQFVLLLSRGMSTTQNGVIRSLRQRHSKPAYPCSWIGSRRIWR